MPYGQIKVDEITFTNAGVDQTISVSGVVASISGNITATGTISGDVIRGGTLVSGATVTGTAGQFGTITGNAAGFTTVTGTTVTGTTAQFTTVTGGTAGFTTITGTTVTGTTANFVTVSGTTVTGNVGNFTTVTGGTVTLTSGVFAAGSATNPSISFTSDPNSGLFSPGADQVAISTNGTGRLFVDASGNVGVGGTGASTAATYGNFVIAKNRADLTGPHLVLGGFDTTAWNNNEEIGAIDFWNNDAGTSGVASQIRSIRTGTLGEGGLLTFSTRESGVSTLNERMRLDSSGRLGLGTTSPAHQLVVGQNAWIGTGGGESTGAGTPRTLTIAANRSATDVSPSLQLLKGYTSASATVGGFKLDLANTSVGAPELAFYSGTSIGNTAASFVEPTWTERARIDSTGRLGLGTSTPNSPFEVGTLGINLDGAIAALPSSGADSAAFIARTASTGSAPFDQAGSIIYRPRVSSTAGRSSHIFYTGSPSAIRMVINEAGNVGIGTSSPSELLSLSSSTGSNIRLERSGTTVVAADNYGTISWFGNDATAGASGIRGSIQGLSRGSSGQLAITFSTADSGGSNTERMRIEAGGNVGIGVTGPQALLHCETTGQELARFNSSNVNGGYLSVQSSGTNVIYIGSAATLSSGTSTQGTVRTQSDLLFATGGGSERARIDSSGRLLVGTSSARGNFFNSTDTALVQVEGANNNAQRYAGHIYGVAGAGGPWHIFAKHRSNSIGGTTVVIADDQVGALSFQGSDGTEFVEAARIEALVDGTPGANDMPGRIVLSTTADGASSPTERMRINSAGNLFCQGVYDNTTGAAANTFVNSNGNLARSTSSIKYKTDVETLIDQYADVILQCRPVWYRSKCDLDNPSWGWWGFIAEEVAEIDPRLVHWKTIETVVQENGSIEHVPCEPEPEGVQYERFVPHLLNLIKRQKEQIEAMEARLSALEAQ
jgi:hypothetical protein